MDISSAAGIRMEKLTENNFHSWKQKIELVLGHRGVDEMIDKHLCPAKPAAESEELLKWLKKDKTARMTIGLTLSDEMLKNVSLTTTALEMWQEICNVHQRHTLLNKLSARREFYTATMRRDESMLTYINRVREKASTLQSMDVEIDDKELAMAVLNGLPPRFGTIITALDAIGDEDESFTFDKVKSRLLQEEKRASLRSTADTVARPSALVQTTSDQRRGPVWKTCTHCGKQGHTERDCWSKHGRPEQSAVTRGGRNTSGRGKGLSAAVARRDARDDKSDSSESDYVCLLAEGRKNRIPDGPTWHVDSGASHHMAYDRSVFTGYRPVDAFAVEMGDKSTSSVVGRGDVKVQVVSDGTRRTCVLKNVLHVPDLGFSLVSVNQLTNLGHRVLFRKNRVEILNGRDVIATGSKSGGLYTLDVQTTRGRTSKSATACAASLQLWHERMGHVHHSGILQMARKNTVNGLDISGSKTETVNCEGCVMGKMARTAAPRSSRSHATGILDLVHTDVAGPMPVHSQGRALYYVTFIDDMSRWVAVYPLKAKSECFDAFKKFQLSAERLTGRKIKALRSDGGGEYISNEYRAHLKSVGIHHQRTVAYTPHQNGVAERMNRTLKDLMRSMLLHKNVPQEFWADAVTTAAYIRNRVTSRGLPRNQTPHALWHGKKPDVSHLRVFGSKCWYKRNGPGRRGLESRSAQAMLIGYPRNQKGYKLWDENKGEVVISRDVVFDEYPSVHAVIGENAVRDAGGDLDDDPSPDYHPVMDEKDAEEPIPEPGSQEPGSGNNDSDTAELDPGDEENVRRSSRVRKPPSEWWCASALLAASPEDKLTYSTATKGESASRWTPAIESEIDSIKRNNTWTLVPRSEARNILSSKWIFKIKDGISKDGAPYEKYKARIVTRGFQQKEGIDYAETFAPVVKFTTLRLFFALVAHLDLECHQMDVKTAFLNGDLDKDVYMEQPDGFKDSARPDHVCKLKKALYGLKQAPRLWFAKIDSFLISELDFESSPYDPCLYVFKTSDGIVIVSLYVDDLLLACSDLKRLNWLKSALHRKFDMTDCGPASVCLGLEIRRDRAKKALHVSQTKYVLKVLERFKMLDCKPVVTPMDAQPTQEDIDGEPVDSTLYRQAIGSAMYLSVGSRPDIAFAVGRLAQFVENPTQPLWVKAKRLLRYISGTRNVGLMYNGHSPLRPVGFSDSDWGGCKIDRRSTGGYTFTMAGAAISWKSKKQGCVARSSSEAEYMALAAAAQEAIWMRNIFQFTQSNIQVSPTTIRVDNQGAIKMARNDSSGTRTKHIDIQYHFVRDSLSKNLFAVDYCPTADNTADILTKPLLRSLLDRHKRALGLSNVPSQENI